MPSKKSASVFAGILLSQLAVAMSLGGGEVVPPVADFDANFCNFPLAWVVARGEGVRVGLVSSFDHDASDQASQLTRLAPEAEVTHLTMQDLLTSGAVTEGLEILLLLAPIDDGRLESTLVAIREVIGEGVCVIMPAGFGLMDQERDLAAWRAFVVEASGAGAVIVGLHGNAYQIGDLAFWRDMPVDTFALNFRVGGDRYFSPGSALSQPLESSTTLAAAGAAILLSAEPSLSPQQIKHAFRQRGREVTWAHMILQYRPGEKQERIRAFLGWDTLDEHLQNEQQYRPEVVASVKGSVFDAALLVRSKPKASGQWAYESLNVELAHRRATGRGVIIAILDHMFDPEDASLQGRLIEPGSVLDDLPVFDTPSQSGHGTWMARVVYNVAPDAKIMPVRICGAGRYGEGELYIRGIEYAVEHGARIISLSHQAVNDEWREALDEAVGKASEAGVVFVFIHYQGQRSDVVDPGPVEFARFDEGRSVIHVVGTNFIDESSFPHTWGLSQTAPMVAGVIALMLEVDPDLTPAQICELLKKSRKPIDGGAMILDAALAVEQAVAMRNGRSKSGSTHQNPDN